MKIALRVVACVVAIAVIQTAVFIVQFAFRGGLGALVRSGALGLTTIIGWLIVLTVGPLAAIQLWRLRRRGLLAAVTLCGIALAYYVIGLLILRPPEAPAMPIVAAIGINALVLLLLKSSRNEMSGGSKYDVGTPNLA
jgi:hypothetical protein